MKDVKRNIKVTKLQIPDKPRAASVSVTFFPNIKTLNKELDILYSAYVFVSLASNDKCKDFKLSFVELKLDAEITNSSNWTFKNFQKYLKNIINILTMSAPAIKKATNIIYELFSSDDVIGEINVPDMVDVFYAKLKKSKNTSDK